LGSTSSDRRRAVRRAPDDVREDLAIRFVNTAAWRLRGAAEERLPNADLLLAWLETNGIGGAQDLKSLKAAWREEPKKARAAYARAIALRESIYELLLAQIKTRAPAPAALSLFNEVLSLSAKGAIIAWRSGALIWTARPPADGSDLLKPIVVSAAELMTGPRAHRVKQCEDDRGCGWLFVDESRAQNRRWCAMGDCGNRAKAKRHYERAKIASQ
jgi:predicted RNA-binding Zn ribbon-like protein